MISHILAPLDGSALAECVLAHVAAIASAEKARITLLHVLEPQTGKLGLHAIDTIEWHLKKRESELYLESVATRVEKEGLEVERAIQEGPAAECIVDFARTGAADLVAMSSHGRSGLSSWTVSSVVQKVILRSFKSILLVPAYRMPTEAGELSHKYGRLFIGMDASARAEYVLPLAISLARTHRAKISLGMVIRRPEMLQRLPLTEEDQEMVNRITERNLRIGGHYLEQLVSQLSMEGVEADTRLVVEDHVIPALHKMVDEQKPDLVMMVAHGISGDDHRTYGSTAASFMAQGDTPLLVLQDIPEESIKRSLAEMTARETKGH